MQNFKKIKQLNERKKEKEFAQTTLQQKRKASNKQKSFSGALQESVLDPSDSPFFVIKNLDNNKLEIYRDESSVEQELLGGNSELPEIERLLQGIWEKYLTALEKEEEEFLEACYQGDVRRVRQGVSNQNKHPIDPRRCLTDEGKNGIHLATLSGSYKNLEIMRTLVDCGVDINGRTGQEERTPLMLGAIVGNEVAVEELLKLNADPRLQDFEGNTALHHACSYDQETIARLLLLYNSPTSIKNAKGKTPLQFCTESMLQMIVKHQEENEGAAKEASVLLEHKLERSALGEMETEMGQWSGWRGERMDQVAIKEIGISCFRKLLLLGRGAFGEVYLAENILDEAKERYAVKVLDKGSIMRQNILRYAMTERKILSTVNHPFVVKLRYAFQTHEKLFLVMDYCPGGDLLALIKRFGVLEEELLRKYMAEIVLAIEALHRAEIIYRDLKPSNIIIDSDGHACLTDFGLSKEAALAHSFCGSTAYLAPEMLWRRGHTKVLDWYLLGVVIYECLTGRPPFWDSNKEQLLANIKSGRYKPLGAEFSKEVRDLVEKLLRSNSNKRLGVNGSREVKLHPWFAEFDWGVVEARGLKMAPLEEVKGKPIKQELFEEDPSTESSIVKGWDYNPHKK